MTKLYVKVTPNSKQDQVRAVDECHWQVKTTKPAVDNQANEAVIKLLAKHLGVSKSKLILIAGEKSKEKTLLLME